MDNQPAVFASALTTLTDITEFAKMVVTSADSVHSALKRLSTSSAKDPDLGYSVLTEEYALRARANILLNDSARHTVICVGFSQADLREFMVSIESRISRSDSMAELLALNSDLITFASAVSAGNERVLNLLAKEFGVVEAGST